MKEQLKKMKTELKELAQTIKTTKPEFKQSQRENDWSKIWSQSSILSKSRHTFRHKHIAYCLLRGRTIEQVETRTKIPCANPGANSCYCCNKPDMKLVDKYMKEVQDAAAATVTTQQ